MDKVKHVIKEMLCSDYFNEWFLALKNEHTLFSIDNIKPCIDVGNNQIRSSFWDGLSIIEHYSTSGKYSDELDDFCIALINDSIKKYLNDNETEKIKRLDSSFAILDSLLRIVFSRSIYVSSCDIFSFVDIYINSPYKHLYSLTKRIFSLPAEEIDGKTLSKLYTKILDAGEIADSYKMLASDNMETVIKKNPLYFYKFSLRKLYETENYFFNMGSFYDYPKEQIHSAYEDLISIVWLGMSSRYVDTSILVDDIEAMLSSDKEHLKKGGLALININFRKLNNVFVDKLSLFCGDKTYYSDFLSLLENNLNSLSNDKIIFELLIEKVKDANWGYNSDILINHIWQVLKKNGADVNCLEETKRDLDFIKNVNKKVYFIDSPMDDELNELRAEFNGKEYDKALELYNSKKSNSIFYSESARKVFVEYLKNLDFSFVLSRLFDFDDDLLFDLAHVYENHPDEYATFVMGLSRLLMEDRLSENISSLLYLIKKLTDMNKNLEAYVAIKNIDYRQLDFRREVLGDSFINDCINECLQMYLEIYSFIAQTLFGADLTAFENLKEIIEYGKTNYETVKFKSVIAFIINRLIVLDEQYALNLANYAFDNDYKNIYPSYLMFSLSKNHSSKFLLELSRRTDFASFIGCKSSDSDVAMSQTILSNRLFYYYFYEDEEYFELIKSFIYSGNIHGLVENIEMISYWYVQKEFEIDKLNNIIKTIKDYYSLVKSDHSSDVDQLIRYISKLITTTNNKIEIAWELILDLFDYFKHYFSDETFELFKTYKDIEVKNISAIMKKYVSSYEQYQTYEETFKNVLNLFKTNKKYTNQLRYWKNIITRKNPDFNF